MSSSRTHQVKSGEVCLHVLETGTPGKPPLLLVHGFPDCHEVFSLLIDQLRHDYHIATFDMRGVARSTPPSSPNGYRLEALEPDVTAVIDAVFGAQARVHLLAHDWGSVLAFSYISHARGRARVRSLTSISGPHLAILRSAALGSLGPKAMLGAIRQLGASWYTFVFQLPWLPELLLRNFGGRVLRATLRRAGVPRNDPYLAFDNAQAWERTQHAIELYRKNVLRSSMPPAPGSLRLPLLVVVPKRDPFVRPSSVVPLQRYAPDLSLLEIDASHWVLRSHPAAIAGALRALTARVDGQADGLGQEPASARRSAG
jgi:pimeloyl-ACP methyl ester carboxylesterase